MGNNQDPYVTKKKHADGQYKEQTAVVNTEGYFAPKKSNTEALNNVKNQ